MDHENQYKYERIDLSTDAIRLLRLLKGFPAEPIQCELFETFLHQMEGVPYEALSYAWGDSPVAYEISINGRRSLVKENLHMALLALRQTEEDRLLWIDAICIDQDNHKEKGHQVGQMRQIYENAEQVVIWLGPSNREIDSLMDFVRRWDYACSQRPGAHRGQGWIDSWIKLTADKTGPYKEVLTAGPRNTLQAMLNRPWFRRVWILQEVASARRATLLCGSKAIPTRGFSLLPFLLEVQLDYHTEAVLDILPGHRREETWWGERQNIKTLLLKFGTSEATDDRDKIYALLGIASDARASNILLPDYEISLGRAICHTISFLLFDEAYDPSARPLPEDMDFTTFLGNLPRLSDYVLSWALRECHDVTAAAVVPKVANINECYYLPDLAPGTGLSPLGFTILKYGLDNTFRAILARHDADVVLSMSQLIGYDGMVPISKKTENKWHAPTSCPTCGNDRFCEHLKLSDHALGQLKHILQHPTARKAKVKDLQPLFHYAGLTSQPRIWELLFEVTHCIDLERSINSLTRALSDRMGDVPDCKRHATAVDEWLDDADGWTIKFIRLMDFLFRRRRTSLDQFHGTNGWILHFIRPMDFLFRRRQTPIDAFQCADQLAELFADVPPPSCEESPNYLVKIIAAWRLIRTGKRLFSDTDDRLMLDLYIKWHDRLLSIRKGPRSEDSEWKSPLQLAELEEFRLISEQLVSQFPGVFVGKVDNIPSKKPNLVRKLGTIPGWRRGDWICP